MKTCCLISTDLTKLRLIAAGLDEVWTAPEPDDPDQPQPLREVAAEAATWVASRLPGRRLDLVGLDVDESRCVWISTPTREAAVVAAAVQQRRADWGEADASAELIQPLVGDAEHAPSRAGGLPLLRYLSAKKLVPTAQTSAAVLEAPDAAVKLWLDALDARSVRLGDTASLWHLVARRSRAERPGAIVATVVVDRPGRLIWTWSRDGDLVAAGVGALPASAAPTRGPAIGRLVLDWLTWTAQLGESPAAVEALAPEAATLAEELRAAWPEAEVRGTDAPDPLRDVLGAVEDAGIEPDARRSTPRLTQRPSRPHRRVYRLAAVAIALAAAGVAGLGWNNQLAATAQRDARAALVDRGRDLVRSIAPGYETNADLLGSLQSYFIDVQRKNPPLPIPPPPRPIFAELDRLLTAATPIEGVTVSRIDLEDRTSSAQFRIAAYADGERLMAAVNREPGAQSWQERVTGTPPNLVQRLTGLWR